MALSNGFHVRPDRISVLAETAETQDEIDVERAEQARQRAQERLSLGSQGTFDIDYARAEAALNEHWRDGSASDER